MAREGACVFFALSIDGDGTGLKTAGWVVEIDGATAVVAVAPGVVEGFAAAVVRSEIGFARLPVSALGLQKPAHWPSSVRGNLPDLRKSRATWFGGEKASLVSSEAEAPDPRRTKCHQMFRSSWVPSVSFGEAPKPKRRAKRGQTSQKKKLFASNHQAGPLVPTERKRRKPKARVQSTTS